MDKFVLILIFASSIIMSCRPSSHNDNGKQVIETPLASNAFPELSRRNISEDTIVGILSTVNSMADLRIDSVTINIVDTIDSKIRIVEKLVSPENYHLYDIEDRYNGPDRLPINLDFTRKPAPKVRCNSVEEFKSLVDTPYVYRGILDSCDVNEDGLTDYLLSIQGTDPDGWGPYQYKEDSLVNKNARGFILVINKGDYFETDIRNNSCFPSDNEDGGVYFPPDLEISSAKNSLTVRYWHGRYGSWGYEFLYQNGNYVLISYSRSYSNGPLLEKSQYFDLVNNKLSIYKLQNDKYIDDREEVGDDKYMTIYYRLDETKPILITDIVNID
ncbi:MAG: hypothetical protein K6G73_10235 [Marinilabiliaceae bacterium]|nr:hypothetical protein [Marinilabiliaceae bacterium]